MACLYFWFRTFFDKKDIDESSYLTLNGNEDYDYMPSILPANTTIVRKNDGNVTLFPYIQNCKFFRGA